LPFQSVQGQDLDLGGVGGQDEHEVVLSNRGDIIVNGGGFIALCVLVYNAWFQVVVDVDLSDLLCSNIGDVEVPGLGAEVGPAGRGLPVDRETRRLAGSNTVGSTAGEVDNVDTEPAVGCKGDGFNDRKQEEWSHSTMYGAEDGN